MSTVDYSSVLGNAFERKRLYRSMGSGFDPADTNLGSEFRANNPQNNFQSTSQAVRQLVNYILKSNYIKNINYKVYFNVIFIIFLKKKKIIFYLIDTNYNETLLENYQNMY